MINLTFLILDSSVIILTKLRVDERWTGALLPAEARVCLLQDLFWALFNSLSTGYRGVFPRGQSGWNLKQTILFRSVHSLMKHRDKFTFNGVKSHLQLIFFLYVSTFHHLKFQDPWLPATGWTNWDYRLASCPLGAKECKADHSLSSISQVKKRTNLSPLDTKQFHYCSNVIANQTFTVRMACVFVCSARHGIRTLEWIPRYLNRPLCFRFPQID
jgi:hypothetical protein